MALDTTERSSSSPSTFGELSPVPQNAASPMASSAQQSPSSRPRSLVPQAFGANGRIIVEPGEIWLSAKKDEAPWPAVICDEELLQMLSKGIKRPDNARMANGKWRKKYLPGGGQEGRVVFPTMKVGIMRLSVQELISKV